MAGSGSARRFEMLEVLGRGGFGTVYRCRQLEGGGDARVVAVKVLNEAAAANTFALARLRDEAHILGQLRHPVIVRVDRMTRIGGRHAVVMEHVEGASVEHVLDEHGPIPLPAALAIVAEVASALVAAYHAPNEQGDPLRLIHRDLKPSNIQLTMGGAVKLLDFGIARADVQRASHSGSIVYGSVPYMAPERMRQEDSHRSDVYSLGVTLLEMLGGRLGGEPASDAVRHRARVAAGVDGLAVTEAEVGELLADCLAFQPDDRPDAAGLERRCRALVDRLGSPGLREWARQVVPSCVSAIAAAEDDLVGKTLVEQREGDGEAGTLSDMLAAVPTTFDQPEVGDLVPGSASASAEGGATRRLGGILVAIGGLGALGSVLAVLVVLCGGLLALVLL